MFGNALYCKRYHCIYKWKSFAFTSICKIYAFIRECFAFHSNVSCLFPKVYAFIAKVTHFYAKILTFEYSLSSTHVPVGCAEQTMHK